MFKQSIAAASFVICCLGNPSMAATSATAVWGEHNVANSCSLQSTRDGKLGLKDGQLNSIDVQNGAAVVKADVIGTAKVRATAHTLTRNGSNALNRNHVKSWIKANNSQEVELWQNQQVMPRDLASLSGGKTTLNLHLRSTANQNTDQSVNSGRYRATATITCYSN